ncbi:MAG: hypothetical protein DRP24_06880, partial [Thermotoga sp.]
MMRYIDDKLREVLERAGESLKDYRQNLLRPEHVLLAILEDEEGEVV